MRIPNAMRLVVALNFLKSSSAISSDAKFNIFNTQNRLSLTLRANC